MNEAFAAGFQFLPYLAQIRLHDLPLHMHERIEAEDKIDRIVGQHRQGATVVDITADMRIGGEAPATRLDAFYGGINNAELSAVIFQIMRPASETGRDF